MLYADVRKFFSNIILDPYTLKDIRLLVSWARQDFINSVMDLRTLQLAEQEIEGGFLSSLSKTRKIEKSIVAVHKEIREKRIVLDDLERALDIAENNNDTEMERRNFYLMELEEAEYADDERYEKRLDGIDKKWLKPSDKEILGDIRKRLAEIYFFIEKIDEQKKREKKWQLYGPPERIRRRFEKYHYPKPEPIQNTTISNDLEKHKLGKRVLCIDENCIGIVGENGCCKECGTPHPDFKK